jgi:group I intron endonuclease
MKKYSVYCHTNKINNKKYVGITSQKPQNRWRNGNGYKGNEHFFRAIQKYGWHNFLHEILYVDLSQEEAEKIEIKLIREWETFKNDKGYNIELGGNVQKNIPQTTKDKISKALKGRKCSEETKIKISKAKKGKPNPNKGKKMSKEFVEKDRLSHLGQKAWNKNRPWTDEEKAKCNGKSVVCVETKIVYKTAHEASRITGIDFSSICKCRRHKVKTAGGYHWVSIEEWKELSE